MCIKGGAIIDHETPRERRIVAVEEWTTFGPGEPARNPSAVCFATPGRCTGWKCMRGSAGRCRWTG